MSSYTLELRHLHETYKVFNFEYDFYCDNEVIKNNFEKKFIDEYYFNEIGMETVARFQHRLKTRLNKIMPYYTQLYQTELRSKDIDFMLNKDLVETFERQLEGNTNSLNNILVNDKNVSDNLESNIDNGNASIELDKGSITNVSKSTLINDNNTSSKGDVNSNMNEKTTLISKGNIGITSSAELLEKWRKILINIDEMIINECSDLFMMIF